MTRRHPSVALLTLLFVAFNACKQTDDHPSMPRAPSVVEVTMREFELATRAKPTVRSGRVIVHARNAGRLEHQLTLLQVPDDLRGTVREQLRSPNRRSTVPLAIFPPRGPNKVNLLAADLPAGRYALVCFVKDKDRQSHAVKGMSLELRVL